MYSVCECLQNYDVAYASDMNACNPFTFNFEAFI